MPAPRRPLPVVLAGAIVALIAVAGTLAVVGRGGPTGPPEVPYPQRVAAIGDSITRGVNADGRRVGEMPTLSWAAGQGDDGVDSIVERIERASGRDVAAVNVARSGATMADAPAQAEQAVAARPDLVTFALGANDLCAASVDAMTDPATFEADLRAALAAIAAGAPEARVLLVGIPDVVALRDVLSGDRRAQFVWRTFRICPAVLGATFDDAARAAVVDRAAAFAEILERVCAEHDRCRSDGGAVTAARFEAADVSALDRFHPSVAGQQSLADAVWAASWWAGR